MASLRPAGLALLLLAAGCAATPGTPQLASTRLTPEQAVINAASVAPQGVSGIFEMPVRAIGRSDTRLFLNSERDYRDQRNLSIEVTPDIERQLAARFGASVEQRLAGAVIAVRGTARRVQIDFIDPQGRPTGKYYYQTHIRLMSASDLTVAGETPRA